MGCVKSKASEAGEEDKGKDAKGGKGGKDAKGKGPVPRTTYGRGPDTPPGTGKGT